MSKLRPPATVSGSARPGGANTYSFKVGDRVTVNDGEKAGVCRFIGKIKVFFPCLSFLHLHLEIMNDDLLPSEGKRW